MKSYSEDQVEFLESLMEVLTLSGYKPKMKENYPAIQIKLNEMNGTKLLIFANPENFNSFSGMSFSKKLEVRYKNVLDECECMVRFTDDLELVEGWKTLGNYDEFVEHQRDGGLMDHKVYKFNSPEWHENKMNIKQLEALNPTPSIGQILKVRRELEYVLD